MLGTMEFAHTLDGEEVGADAFDVGTHARKHAAELLQVGFAGSVVDGGGAFGADSRHDDVGSAGDGGFVEQHVATREVALGGLDAIEVALGVVGELSAEALEADEVGVETATTNLVTTGLGQQGMAETRDERAKEHDRAAQRHAATQVVVTFEVSHIDVVGAEAERAAFEVMNDDTHLAQEFDEVEGVEDLGDVGDGDFLAGEEHGTKHFEGFVLGSLGLDGATQGVATFDDET